MIPGQENILPGERELFHRVSADDEQAFAEVFLFYTARLYPFVRKMTRSDSAAEEVVQNVFIRVWKHRSKLPEIENYRSWIFRIAANLTYTYLSKKARDRSHQEAFAATVPAETDSTSDFVDFKETSKAIENLVAQLPPQRRTIFRLSREHGLTYEEIGRELGISRNTVRNQMVEALKFLKEHTRNNSDTYAVLLVMMLNAGI